MESFTISDNPILEIIARILVSVLLGFVIGLERELTNKSAGLRTNILVCLGSTVFTILSIYAFTYPENSNFPRDPARIAAQIVTGIGFIGGGTVLRHGVSVFGLTTAATLWIVAAIGMAVGAGSYLVALVTTIVAFLVLVLIRELERGYLSRHTARGAKIRATILASSDNIYEVQNWIYNEFEKIIDINVKKIEEEDIVKLKFTFELFDANPICKAYKKFKELKEIKSLTLQQVIDEPY